MVCIEVCFLRICEPKIKCKFIASDTIDFSRSITAEVVCKEEARGCWLCCYKSEKTINSSQTEAAVEARPVNYKFQAQFETCTDRNVRVQLSAERSLTNASCKVVEHRNDNFFHPTVQRQLRHNHLQIIYLKSSSSSSSFIPLGFKSKNYLISKILFKNCYASVVTSSISPAYTIRRQARHN